MGVVISLEAECTWLAFNYAFRMHARQQDSYWYGDNEGEKFNGGSRLRVA